MQFFSMKYGGRHFEQLNGHVIIFFLPLNWGALNMRMAQYDRKWMQSSRSKQVAVYILKILVDIFRPIFYIFLLALNDICVFDRRHIFLHFNVRMVQVLFGANERSFTFWGWYHTIPMIFFSFNYLPFVTSGCHYFFLCWSFNK